MSKQPERTSEIPENNAKLLSDFAPQKGKYGSDLILLI